MKLRSLFAVLFTAFVATSAQAADDASKMMSACGVQGVCANEIVNSIATPVTVSASGSITAGTTVTATAGAITATAGEFVSSASGKTLALQEATAGDACMGTLTCNGASDVVTSTTCATTGSRIFLTRTSLDADTSGDFYVKSLSTGVSFTVACEASDTGTLNWIIFHEAP